MNLYRSLSIRQKQIVWAWAFLALPVLFYTVIRFYPTGNAILALDLGQKTGWAVHNADGAIAIRDMLVRGAPLIGATAAIVVNLGLIADAVDPVGELPLLGAAQIRPGRDQLQPNEDKDMLRLDVGVVGRPTHTLVLARPESERPIRWDGGSGLSRWREFLGAEGPVVAATDYMRSLVDQVDFVSFTGSSATGRLVAERAARRLVGCSLELGGKSPNIVFDDAALMHPFIPWDPAPASVRSQRPATAARSSTPLSSTHPTASRSRAIAAIAGSWLIASVCIDLMKHRSSTMSR